MFEQSHMVVLRTASLPSGLHALDTRIDFSSPESMFAHILTKDSSAVVWESDENLFSIVPMGTRYTFLDVTNPSATISFKGYEDLELGPGIYRVFDRSGYDDFLGFMISEQEQGHSVADKLEKIEFTRYRAIRGEVGAIVEMRDAGVPLKEKVCAVQA